MIYNKDMKDLTNRIAIVTGASSGIGEATARLLTQAGARVALVARSKDKLATLTKQLPGSISLPADLTDPIVIKKMINSCLKQFGRIDILINNAGRGYDAAIDQIELKKIRSLYDLNVFGPLIAMQLTIPIMTKQHQGSIINVSSGTSLMTIPSIGAYSSSKAALNMITLTAREELAALGIKVSVVYPYFTDTNFPINKLNRTSTQRTEQDEMYRRGDQSETVAEKILEAITSGEAEIFARESMKNLKMGRFSN